MLDLTGTPYMLMDQADNETFKHLKDIEERVYLLRGGQILTAETLKRYYGEKRYEQVAESNALEGSTLNAGETEIAVARGVTISGHDPAYSRDAQSLDRALTRVAEMARYSSDPLDVPALLEIHELLLGDRPGAGIYRDTPVHITGSDHRPPKTRKEIMDAMEHWEQWSIANALAPAPMRSAVLHAWLTHIHPFIDGNGRTARAIGNLELIRAGYPPIIIKKKEKSVYIEALAESDRGGDINPFMYFIFQHVNNSLTGLELSAKQQQGYSVVAERLQRHQKRLVSIWVNSVRLFASTLELKILQATEVLGGRCGVMIYDDIMDHDDFIEYSERRTVSGASAFRLKFEAPGVPKVEKLAFVGFRSARMAQSLGEQGPSLFWSHRNPQGYPPWKPDNERSPYALEITSKLGNGDEWYARLPDDRIEKLNTSVLAGRVSDALFDNMID